MEKAPMRKLKNQLKVKLKRNKKMKMKMKTMITNKIMNLY